MMEPTPDRSRMMKVEFVTLAQTRAPGFCNVVNPNRDINNDEYKQKTQDMNYTKYMHLLKDERHTYEFDKEDVETLIAAGNVTNQTGHRSRIHVEELDELEAKLQLQLPSDGPFFMRLDACSTKDANNGRVIPVKTAADIVRQITLSSKAVYALSERNSNYMILKKWRDDIAMTNEFRCFFNGYKLTAVSQYVPYEELGWSSRTEELLDIAKQTQEAYDSIGKPFDQCVMDVHYLEKSKTVEIIEFGSFGWQMNTGPACFDWQRDHDVLHDSSTVTVRVVRKAG